MMGYQMEQASCIVPLYSLEKNMYAHCTVCKYGEMMRQSE